MYGGRESKQIKNNKEKIIHKRKHSASKISLELIRKEKTKKKE